MRSSPPFNVYNEMGSYITKLHNHRHNQLGSISSLQKETSYHAAPPTPIRPSPGQTTFWLSRAA